jgi:hypothetical protein
MAREAVLDTKTIAAVLRLPARGRAIRGPTVFDKHVARGALVVVVDDGRGIISEWVSTAGPDVHELVRKWAEGNGLKLVRPRTMPSGIRNCDTEIRLRDTVDKLVVRTALAADDKNIVAEDSDFWHPDIARTGGMVGDPSAPMCSLLRAHGISVHTLPAWIGVLNATP